MTENGMIIQPCWGGIKVTNIDANVVLHIIKTTDGFLIDGYTGTAERDNNIIPSIDSLGIIAVSNKNKE